MPNKVTLLKSFTSKKILIIAFTLYSLSATIFALFYLTQTRFEKNRVQALTIEKNKTDSKFNTTQKAYIELKNQDQYKINQQLKKDLNNTHTSYTSLIGIFEGLQDLKTKKQEVGKLEEIYASAIKDLSDLKYSSAGGKMSSLSAQIKKINTELEAAAAAAAAAKIASQPQGPAQANNNAPASGFSYQSVSAEIGNYTVSIVAADLNSTRVIVDTASDSDCHDSCPVMSLGDYVARNGAFAGINGSYFCPASYPSCAGKTNSFDTLLMNKNKHYLNSDNNVYSTVPVAVFGSGFARFIGQSSGWGRDTGVDGVIANQPLLLSGGNIAFGGGSDPKQGSKGARSFVGNKGNIVYIGIVYNASVAEVAYVLKALGLENALNLDSGGSTALWSGGYKAGPGRNIPNAILFVKK